MRKARTPCALLFAAGIVRRIPALLKKTFQFRGVKISDQLVLLFSGKILNCRLARSCLMRILITLKINKVHRKVRAGVFSALSLLVHMKTADQIIGPPCVV